MFECYEFEACEYNAQPKCCLPDGVECPHGVASHEPSDIEKLIEQLKEKDGLWCSIQTGEALIANTITALSTIQAENEKLRAELEQAKEEITRLKYYEDKCHDCPIVCAKTEIIKAHEELETVQAELEQVKAERDAAVDCIYKIEDALDRGNDNDWAREHISEWESQKED